MLQISLLGSASVRREDGTEVERLLSHPKRLAVLAYLALETPRGYQRRDALLAMFWPEGDEPHARAALRQLLYGLRNDLGDSTVITRGSEEVKLNPDTVRCDVWQFDEARIRGATREAVELYTGQLLNAFHLNGAPAFERWLEGERNRYAQHCEKLLEHLVDQAELDGDLAGATAWLERLLQIRPYKGGIVERLMHALVKAGDRARAIRLADAYAERLREELGAEPSQGVVTLALDLRKEPAPTEGARGAAEGIVTGTSPRSSPQPAPRDRSKRRFSDWFKTLLRPRE